MFVCRENGGGKIEWLELLWSMDSSNNNESRSQEASWAAAAGCELAHLISLSDPFQVAVGRQPKLLELATKHF